MTAIFAPTGATPAIPPTAPPAGTSALGGLGSDAFLKLLVAQLRFQNPMAPSDPAAMLQQTAQFTQVETLQQMTSMQQQLLGLSKATMAADMVGKEVTARAPDGKETTGVVDGVRFTESGPLLSIGDAEVPVESVTRFGRTVAPEAPATTS